MMINISFNTVHMPWPFLNQTQDSHGKWNNLQISLNPANGTEQYDYLVVYDDIKQKIKTHLPKSRRILFIAEPPSIASYPSKYLNQFGIVICPYALKGFKGQLIISQTALPWHFGVNRAKNNASLMNFEALGNLEIEDKLHKISVVCSNKTMTAEHRLRLEFIQKAKERLGDRLDIYGRGFKEIDDKAEVVIPYQFHLVLENNFENHFWTEKLSDTYLGLAYPVYSGCKNIGTYFDQDMITEIDIYNAEESIQRLESILDQPDFYQQRLAALVKAKQKVMNEYNMFPLIENIIQKYQTNDKNLWWSGTIKPIKACHKSSKKVFDILYPYKVKLAKIWHAARGNND